MSRWRSVWLVARREILERGRSRGFILSVLLTTTLVIGSFIIPTIIFGDDDVTKIGLVEPAPAGLAEALEATAAAARQDVEIVPYPDRAAAEAALDSEAVAVAVSVPADLSGAGEILYDEDRDALLDSIVGGAVVALRVEAVLANSNVDQGALAAAQAPPATVELDPQTDADEARFLLANIGTVLILVSIFSFGFTVLTGVVEEKQSRVVEVVLSTVRPSDLLMGKVLGIGYTFYSTALGTLGALASRMEEASNASSPVSIVASLSYVFALLVAIQNPDGVAARIATFLPPVSPMIVPLRAALGAIEPWEIALAVVVNLAAIWLLLEFGGRVYSGAVLQTGGRMKLRDAWRAAARQ